jgi:ATP-binding cassette, subfamily B, bacterial PglK
MALSRFQLLRQVYSLVRPFGRRRLAGVILFNLGQAVLQAATVIVMMLFAGVLMAKEGAAVPSLPLLGEIGGEDGFLEGTSPVLFWCVIFVIVVLLSNLWNLAGEFVRSHYAARTGFLLTSGILRTVADRPYSFHLRNNSSLLMKKANGDVVNFVQGVLAPMLDFNARLLMVLFICGSLVVIDPLIALSLSGIFLLFYFGFFLVARRFWKLLNDQFNLLAKIAYKSVYQFLTGIKPILVHGVRHHFLETYEEAARKNVRYRSLSPVVANGPRYIVEIVVFGGGVTILTFLVMGGTSVEALAPTAVSFLYGGYRLLPNIQLMFGTIGSIRTHSYTVREILDDFSPEDLHRVHERLPRPAAKTLPFVREIGIEAVEFRYTPDAELVLAALDLRIQKGAKVAFVGHTGSGKSTLVDMILGLHTPSAGRILIDDTPLTTATIPAWRKRIGYVPQDIFLTDESVRRNIAFGLRDAEIDEEAVREAVRMAQAEEFIFERLPEGLDTLVGERGVRLSGGQRQRIGLARALYHRPDVLVLDEATSALDNATEAAIMEVIDGLAANLTIIMIAHRLSTVRRADCIHLLNRGRIVASGRYEELLQRSDDFRTLAASAEVG